MAMQAIQEQLHHLVQCKVCLEDKENQKLLPCQHTLCLDCLNNLAVTNGKYKCSICVKEMFVPNGGFEALPNSLSTRQLADLMNTVTLTAQRSRSPIHDDIDDDTTDSKVKPVISAAQRKLVKDIENAKESFKMADSKKEMYAKRDKELVENETEMTGKFEKLREEINTTITNKIEALQKRTKAKRLALEEQVNQLQAACNQVGEGVQKMEAKLDNLKTSGEDDVGEDLSQAQSALESLKDELQVASPSTDHLKVGDSVMIAINKSLASTYASLEKATNHCSVGYIWHIREDGMCLVFFSGNAVWGVAKEELEKSPIKHELPVLGGRVKVQHSVTKPYFEWQGVKPDSIGVLAAIKDVGPPNGRGREVVVNFPEKSEWKGLYEDLESIPDEPLKVGETVWISKDVSEPARGWAGVTLDSVGKLVSIDGENVTVQFPELESWQGVLPEIERVRDVLPGDRIRVKKSVKEPKMEWKGVTHDDVGVVRQIREDSDHGKFAVVKFPNITGTWNGIVDELEIVRSQPTPGVIRQAPAPGNYRQAPADADIDPQQVQRMTQHMMQQAAQQIENMNPEVLRQHAAASAQVMQQCQTQ